jgi:Xaa-Pro dipeptidase
LADNPFVAVGPESAMAHARASNRRPSPGEVVPIMMSASVHRYQCPVERTYTFGNPSKDLERSLSTVCQAVETVIDKIRPGMRSSEADALARDVYDRADLGQYFLNRLGYSFGLAYPPVWWENEIMQLRPHDDRVIEEGMVFHLVPALHVPGQGFLNRSMPIVITANGCEPLIEVPVRVEPL